MHYFQMIGLMLYIVVRDLKAGFVAIPSAVIELIQQQCVACTLIAAMESSVVWL